MFGAMTFTLKLVFCVVLCFIRCISKTCQKNNGLVKNTLNVPSFRVFVISYIVSVKSGNFTDE